MTTTANIQGNNISGILSDIQTSLGGGSLQLKFAALQLAQSEISKNGAMEYMKQVEEIQAKQKEASEMMKACQTAQNSVAAGKIDGNEYCGITKTENGKTVTDTVATQKAFDYFKDNNIAYDKSGGDFLHTKDQWEKAITGLQTHIDSLGTRTQTLMVFLQDLMGQYNSHLQGANSCIQQSNQTLQQLATLR